MRMRVSAAAAYWMLIVVTLTSVTGKPVSTMRTQKRQSDQRVAELETLLALQKYGAHHFLRAGDGEKSFFPAYGIIDFNKIGRKKKSSPPENEVHDWLIPSWTASSLSSSSSPRNPSSETTRLLGSSSSRSKWKAAFPVQSHNPEDGIGDK